MGRKTENGFTIVEVMLFLGVSGLLLVGIMAATGRAVADARFTDALKTAESFLQRQYEDVVNGVNTRDSTQGCGSTASRPGTGDCYLIGKAIHFDPNTSNVMTFTVTASGDVNTDDDTITALGKMVLNSTNVNEEQYELAWGMRFIQGKRTKTPTPADTVAYLRSPTSSQIETFVFDGTLNGARTSLTGLGGVVSNSASRGNSLALCVNSADGVVNQYLGALKVSRGQGAATITSERFTTAQWSAQC